MDFLQVVDRQSLTSASVVHVLVELVVVAICAVALGVGLRVVPEKLVPRSKATRSDAAGKSRPTARPNTAIAAPAATRPPAATAPKPVVASKAPPVAASPAASSQPPPTTRVAAPAPASKADNTLDDVLDSFFEDESLLDEALLDTAAPTAELTQKATPSSPTARAGPTHKSSAVFSKEMAEKMTKGLQGKAPAAPRAAPAEAQTVPPTPADTAATADQKLDDALDAYLAEEQLLDEAILDSAVQAAQH